MIMRIAVIGTGYVGLVTGTCFAESGNNVTCVDINADKIAKLNQGEIPIYEPGLHDLVKRNLSMGRLAFTTQVAEAVRSAKLIFLAVGTPSNDTTGETDLSALWAVLKAIAPHVAPDGFVVIKSTVPPGTNQKTYEKLRELTGRTIDVASNPEFLKEGAAINDFQYPDRVVVGVRSEAAENALRELYAPFLRTDHPFLVMTPESAELTKYVANALLAAKISFINEMANICEKMQGDINDVRRGIGHDRRIGFAFLFPGVGYGGSCFPKDVRSLICSAKSMGIEPDMLEAIERVNNRQKHVLLEKIQHHYGASLKGKTLAIWGLAFKPRTDDIREAPALVLIDELLKLDVKLHVFDPEAANNVKQLYGDKLKYAANPMEALQGAHALAINTEWGDFHTPDFTAVKQLLADAVIFDGRNLYEPERMQELGFSYYSIGRPTVRG
jgi:UDPglucose 6-dehydrogenase